MSRQLTPLLFAGLLSGCAAHADLAQIDTQPVTNRPVLGSAFKGIPMRVKTQQIVEIWHLDPKSQTYILVAEGRQVLADQKHLYAVNVISGPFASPQLNVSENPDNTLKSIEVASTENNSGAIDAATAAVAGVSTVEGGKFTACSTANATLLSANQAVATAQAAYDALSPTASQSLKDAYQAVIAKAQAQAAYARTNPAC